MKIRKVFAVALIAAICLSMYFAYSPAFAEDISFTAQDGLCVHHPEHTQACGYYLEAGEETCGHIHDDACGYVAPTEEQPCTHVHDAACGYVEAREAVPCDQGCTDLDDDSVIDHVEGCAYQPAVAGQPCNHTHDETCGYAEAVAGQPCAHVHDETCGYVDPSQTGVCVYAQAGCPYCVVDWQWSDPQGFLTQEADGSWSMDMPGVSASNPVSASALQSFLPTQIATRMDNDTKPVMAIAWDLTAIPANGATSGDYILEAYLVDSAYALTDAAAPLQVTLRLGGAETYAGELSIPAGEPKFPQSIVTGVSPAGTTIDLFDYWVTNRTDADNGYTKNNNYYNKGINANHALLFITGDLTDFNPGNWNKWTGDASMTALGYSKEAPFTNIVQNKLEDGYPVLNSNVINTNNSSLHSSMQGRNGRESLAYLFDPKKESEGKASFSDVKGLLQVDKDGYYYYNSRQNYAVFYEEDNAFTLYDHPGVIPGGTSPVGQFFPFNQATVNAEKGEHNGASYDLMNKAYSTDSSINHYFGMHMSTRFIQQFGGHVSAAEGAEAVTYEFSGDDDVWIFIDGTLVADLGGIHDAASVKIDFSTGKIWINDTLKNEKLGRLLGKETDTLPDNTYHTLDFFYLERGNTDSNMYLKYNLVTIPESSVIKVDQIGDPVPDAQFSLYAANDPNNAIATGTTNRDGEFVFVDESGFPITISSLFKEYAGHRVDGNDLILKETFIPEGYRSNGEIGLYFYQAPNNGEVLLLSNSTWDKGAYAMAKVTSTLPTTIALEPNANQTYPEGDNTLTLNPTDYPLLFAVVYQKQSDGSWRPVSGDPLNGWKVHDSIAWQDVLAAAQANPYIFQLASSGAYQVEVSNLPGDITTYYYICGDEDQAQYSIGYYYTTAKSISEATATNTWRIDSENETYLVDRMFSANLYVSNIKNYLLVQKVDDEGTPVNEAEFSLYKAEVAEVAPDGTVTIPEGAAVFDTVSTSYLDTVKMDGGGSFPATQNVLPNGEYYLVETSVPYGYKMSDQAIHIVVNNTGVYADAGEKDDGVEVMRGVGSIIHSMVQFAADDDVDATLHDIKAALAVGDKIEEINTDGIWSTNNVLHLRYANENALLDYGLYDGTAGNLDNLSLSTDVGWSKLIIQQCYNHSGDVDTSLKTDLKDRDLTNLFSGTVTVRVTNERVGNLTISKEVKVISGSPDLENQSFTFSIYNQKGGTPISGTYDAIDKEGNKKPVVFDEEGNTTVVLKKGESLTILGLPYDSYYKVEEKLITGYNVSIVKNNGDKVESAIIEGSIPHSTSEDRADTLAFTNSYDGATRVQLSGSKIMEGRHLTTNDKFTFSLGVYDTQTQTAVNSKKIELPENLEKSVTAVGNTNQAELIFDFITFHEAGIFTFAINEERPTNATAATNYVYDGIKYDPSTILAVVTVTLDNDTNKLVADVEYFLKGDNDERTELKEMTFTNTGAYDLTIAKKVEGEMGDRDKLFTFQIQLKESDGSILTGEYDYTGGVMEGMDGITAQEPGTLQLENGAADFTLSHGQTITIHGLPVGTSYTITEPGAQADGYTVTPTGGVTIYQDGHCEGTLDQATTVTYKNHKGTAVPTGIRFDALPWLLALLCGLAGCTALCMTGKRHRRKGGCGRTHG